MESMQGGRLWSYFHGLWNFRREVCALRPPNQILASINDGCASFIPWHCPTDQNQPGKRKIGPNQADDMTTGTVQSPGRILLKQKEVKASTLLYREQGMLVNHESELATPALVNRQYIYCFPTDSPLNVSVYHCSAKSRSDSTLNPSDLSVTNSALSDNFRVGEHFQDLSFPNETITADAKLPSEITAVCTHYCDPDVYEGVFLLKDDKRFSIKWTVTGPQKSYSISTDYVKKQS